MIRVAGFDPSLTAFGCALLTLPSPDEPSERVRMTGAHAHTWKTTPRQGKHERFQRLLTEVASATAGADLVVIEGLAYGAKGSAVLDLAGLHWLVRQWLWAHHHDYAVIPPSLRAKWLTGKGNAPKDECLAAAIKRFPDCDVRDNNQADALTLAAMGAEHLGVPLVPMPADRRELLYTNNRKGQPQIGWPERNHDG